MYKVFIDDAPLMFKTSDEASVINSIELPLSEALVCREHLLRSYQQHEKQLFTIVCENKENALKEFFQHVEWINASGGLVKRKKRFLAIKRFERWDLPKGKMEEGETPLSAAIREVEEECGIQGVQAGPLLTETFHTYSFKDKEVLKRTYWFALSYEGKKRVRPQEEEGIEKVKWCKRAGLEKKISTSYASIQEVWNSYCNLEND